ncbi:MAG: toll/interleukin-1 receptor domain-containing protein [Bacteroidetes bacterium]|nr:toll/interleukin-1 receptor domain-containing protein [Bacteroidota bacterium]
MAYDIDVLITYAEKDNEAGKKNSNDQGWVTQFKKFLELMLHQVKGETSNIVLKSEFDDFTASSLSNAAVLVVILSKDFVQSGRCLDTVESYFKATADSGMTRVFKVLKSPLSTPEQPPRLRELLGYDMFQLDNETGQMKEYADFFSQEAEKQYWMKMVDLVYDVHDTITMLNGQSKSEIRNIYKKKTIYLAETGHDLSIQRNIIKRELQRHGYVVLPSHPLPMRNEELERVVRKDLEECSLSVHLIGSAYGEIPEGSERSVVDLQNKLAAEHAVVKRSRKEEFSRLIWIAPNLRNASDRQKGFIDSLRRDIEAQEGAEILQNPLEDFKNIMREELQSVQERKDEQQLAGKTIYLVHDKVDHEMALPLIDIIQKSGFNVVYPAFEGDLMEVRRKHIENLRRFDGAIILKGKVNDQWVRMKVLDLLKAPGFGRNKPIQGKAIVSQNNLDTYKNQDVTLITGDKDKSIESLKMFLQEFKS